MKRSWQIAARKDRTLGASLALGLGLFAALLALVLFAPRRAWAQDENDPMHDAGDEEMLTGQPSQPAVRRPTAPGEEGPAAELSYATRLERTAVWVGDPFHYQILVDHSPNIEFVLQNLNKDTLLMEPLKVLDVTCNGAPCQDAADSSVLLKNGNKRLIVEITLASFTVGEPE